MAKFRGILSLCVFLAGLVLPICQCQYQILCQTAVGDYRDCTCGVQFRDLEVRCCNDQTCLKPTTYSENSTCPFACANGGTYDSERRLCICTDGHGGLCCETGTPACGKILLAPSGKITENGAGGPLSTNCGWRISTDPWRRIALGAKLFDLDTFNCSGSSLSVYDGETRSTPLITTVCGQTSFRTLYSSGRHLYIEYTKPKMNFELDYVTFFAGDRCGPQKIYWRATDIITSPQYPLSYPPDTNCSWEVRIRPDKDLVLTILEMDLRAKTLNCTKGDKLILSKSDGENITSLCGIAVESTAYKIRGISSILLTFSSDSTNEGKGFKLRYEQIPIGF